MAKGKTVKLVVVTPERQVLEETAEAVVIPAHDGELGILPDRAPLMCELGIGQMRYRRDGATRRLFIDGGFAQVLDNNVTVLTEHAAPAEEISDEMVAEAEHSAAELPGKTLEEVEARRRAKRRASVLRNLQVAH
ncbi:MAG: ATP synthase F1 subunit epsilon [Phycisphaerae bacterium]